MAIYVDLQPTPQFDKSLVTYCVVNFGRIKDALGVVGKRILTESPKTTGPWPRALTITAPFVKQDIYIWSNISYYSTVIGFLAMLITFNGGGIGPYSEKYFNEPGAKRNMSSAGTVRNIPMGSYSISQQAITGGIASDAQDIMRLHVIYYEL